MVHKRTELMFYILLTFLFAQTKTFNSARFVTIRYLIGTYAFDLEHFEGLGRIGVCVWGGGDGVVWCGVVWGWSDLCQRTNAIIPKLLYRLG